MIAGHLREKRGYFHIVLSYVDENGKRQTPSKSTGLPIKGNKKRAEAMLMEARKEMEDELKRRIVKKDEPPKQEDILFTQFMSDWLEMMKNSVEITTFASYTFGIESKILGFRMS